MPEKPFSWVPRENLLSFEELFSFVRVAIDEGIEKIRITGGEPLLREDLDRFIEMIHNHKSDIDLALTTNGYLLESSAKRLKEVGLKRINVSIDTLKPEVAERIAQKDVLDRVLAGVDRALEVGLKVKVNMVPLKGINEDEILDVMEYAKSRSMTIRYIEYMENVYAKIGLKGLNGKEILAKVKERYTIHKVGREGSSPAFYYLTDDGYKFGLIDPHKHDFCESCNRIRLTAEGFLIPCLYFDEAMSIKDAVKRGDIDGASEILREVLRNKPEKNRWNENDLEESSRAFYETGG
jgi:cyclic pyranopterin phosphate synthase